MDELSTCVRGQLVCIFLEFERIGKLPRICSRNPTMLFDELICTVLVGASEVSVGGVSVLYGGGADESMVQGFAKTICSIKVRPGTIE